jgi:hypothetical protein
MTILIAILCAVAVLALGAAVIIAAVKKIPVGDALKVIGLGALTGILLAAGVIVAILRRKNETDNSGGLPTDSGSPSIGTAFDERKDKLRSRIEELLQQAGSR